MVHIYNVFIIQASKGQNHVIWGNLDKPEGHKIKWNKPGAEDKQHYLTLCGSKEGVGKRDKNGLRRIESSSRKMH